MSGPKLEVLFLGTGVSECVPNIACATDPHGCLACRNALKPGSRDARRQSNVIVRITHTGQDPQHILIDCGSTFAAAAVAHLPRLGIRRLDAVLLTHGHADCINGLGELRAWTMNGAIQDSMPIYLDQPTHSEVKQCFPYLVNTQSSTAAAVAELDFQVFDRSKPFQLCGVTIVPFDVEHGRIRSLGFVIDGRLLYLPDYSRTPEESFQIIEQAAPSLSLAIIGTVRIQPHPALGSLPQTVATAQRLKVPRVLMTKLADGITHEAWVSIGAALSKGSGVRRDQTPRWTSFADYELPEAMTTQAGYLLLPPRSALEAVRPELTPWASSRDLHEQIRFTALHALVGLRDDDTTSIVELALSEIGRHVDAPLGRMTLAPAYDGLLVEVD